MTLLSAKWNATGGRKSIFGAKPANQPAKGNVIGVEATLINKTRAFGKAEAAGRARVEWPTGTFGPCRSGGSS
ncbi:hypothetical protein NC652_015245 [Populus alba x Populus x berolinensis]|nr:hypothetical protein NC652_015245 [Populus alba x Populus x berolinensis]